MFRVILFQISARALLCKTAHFVLLLLHMPVHLGVSDIYTSSALSDLNSWRDLEDSREEKNIGGKRMLGKRPRPPLMNRTRSMSQLGSADFAIESEQIPDSPVFHMGPGIRSSYSLSNKPIEPAHFLDACSLCKRRLSNGLDIYMYR